MTTHPYAQLADRAERLALVALLGFLAYRLIPHVADKPANLAYLVSETIVIIMIACRRSAHAISHRSADWVIGFAGTFLPLMVVRSSGAGAAYASVMLLLGFAIAVSAQLSLFRSFGVVASGR